MPQNGFGNASALEHRVWPATSSYTAARSSLATDCNVIYSGNLTVDGGLWQTRRKAAAIMMGLKAYKTFPVHIIGPTRLLTAINGSNAIVKTVRVRFICPPDIRCRSQGGIDGSPRIVRRE